jgi:serine/threonine-protein kinase
MSPPPAALTAALASHYRLDRELGQGGMATVYLAHDLKHDRDVALKVLRPELAAVLGGDRFLQEIRLTAQLQHPHIVPLLDSGEVLAGPGIPGPYLYYVLPYIEGESLRERLTRERQLPLEDALRITRAVAGALQYAHDRGVIHRDIKPENILLSRGEPIVADFGIALAVEQAGGTRFTETGLSLGTPRYMSPEQAAGDRALDGRSDQYSLACVLYEMLAGEPPFTGASLQAITAKKLADTAPSLRRLRDTVSPGLDAVIHIALARVPADRYASCERFAEALQRPPAIALQVESAAEPPSPASRQWLRLAPWVVSAVLGVLAGAMAWRSHAGVGTQRPVHLGLSMPPGLELVGSYASGGIAVSPDGLTIAFAAGTADSTRLYLRRLDDWTIRPLPGTEGAADPFFSPDGRWIGFSSPRDRTLRKIAVDGGVPVTLCTASTGAAGTWADNDTIYFTGYDLPNVLKVPASGGAPSPVTKHRPAGYFQRGFLRALPGGRLALVTLSGGGPDGIGVVDLRTGDERVLLKAATQGRWVAPGYVVFARAQTDELAAVRVDWDARPVAGDPITVARGIAGPTGWAAVFWDVSPSGTLAFVPGTVRSAEEARMVLVDHDGHPDPHDLGTTGDGPRFSPDGRTLLFWRRPGPHIWTLDLARGVARREAVGEGTEFWSAWSPDGAWIVFESVDSGDAATANLFRVRPGGGPRERLTTEPGVWHQPHAWAGGELVFTRGEDTRTGMDIYAVAVPGGSPHPILAGTANEMLPAVSRDGRFLAYTSDVSGTRQVYVRRYPDGADIQVSSEGGQDPLWSPDGRQLYYRSVSGRDVYAASVSPGDRPAVGTPAVLFTGPFWASPPYGREWDLSPDGRRFVLIRNPDRLTRDGSGILIGGEMRVIPGWGAELERTMRRPR